MEFTILHQTTYRYHKHVHESYTLVHLQPRSDVEQYCTRYDLQISPRSRIYSYTDRFANDVQHFAVVPDHDVLSVTARSNVMTVRPHDPPLPRAFDRSSLESDPTFHALYDFRRESAYVEFAHGLRDLDASVGDPPDGDLAAWFLLAGAAIHREFAYDKEATTVTATVAQSVRLRRGVCQDFAHILVALCRVRGIPARYVSGYVYSGQEGSVLGAEASHAWCEAYLGPSGWVGYDPTNDTLVNDEFVKIAVGRDYGDVSPVRGLYKGRAEGAMSVNVAMEALQSQQEQ